ncbi:DUF317 domain-containing protein [Streptomyces sp. CBMA123]|uniref:DUF317 domain-containing protein n=1 Tax=Streptomyces sp. CBMA123 TaxID=1896313 RepID=UPI001661CA10|nr:DUF317 domain-containing protein [Streptomyces sp. CBMA123]MBD0688296.1 hypothetical protein [Streptomyces sp. CBMA123]
MPSTPDEFLVHPRYLAGAGEIGRVLQPVVHAHGWPFENNPYGNRIAATSPCGRIEVLCQMAVFHLWKISVRDRPGDERPRWQATFTKETPAEIVGALVQALAADRYRAPEEIVAEWPGHPSTAWRPLLKAGWTPSDLTELRIADPATGTVSVAWPGTEGAVATVVDGIRLTSPDGKASLVHTPKPDHLFGEGVGPWQIDCTFGPAWQDQWTAILSSATPVRYLNMLMSSIADPAPVVRAHAQISSATRTAATIRSLPPSRSSNQFRAFEAEMATLDPRHPNQGHPRR